MKNITLKESLVATALALAFASGAQAATVYSYRLAAPGTKAAPTLVLDVPALGPFALANRFLVNGPFAAVAPSSTSAGAFAFSSSDPSVATVSGAGVVTPLKAGTAAITATQAPVGNFASASTTANLTVVQNPSQFVTWDPAQTGTSVYLSNGNLTIDGGANNRGGSRGTFGVSSGKWYWEETVQGNSGGTCWISGISDSRVPGGEYYQNNAFVFAPGFGSWQRWLGATPSATSYPAASVNGTYMFALDMDNGALYVGLNGVWMNSAVPTSGAQRTGAILSGVSGTVYPQINMYYGGGGCPSSMPTTANFGTGTFKYAVPTYFNPGLYR